MRLVFVEIGANLVGFLDLGFWLPIITFFSPYGSRIFGGYQWWFMCVVV